MSLFDYVRSLGDTTFDCPHCGRNEDGSECETASEVVSYWGDREPQEFICSSCDKSYFVKEHVRRSFTVAMTPEDCE